MYNSLEFVVRNVSRIIDRAVGHCNELAVSLNDLIKFGAHYTIYIVLFISVLQMKLRFTKCSKPVKRMLTCRPKKT